MHQKQDSYKICSFQNKLWIAILFCHCIHLVSLAVPGKPLNLKAFYYNTQKIIFTWSPPASGGAPTGYVAYMRYPPGTAYVAYDGTGQLELQAHVNGPFVNNGYYEASVVALNGFGSTVSDAIGFVIGNPVDPSKCFITEDSSWTSGNIAIPVKVTAVDSSSTAIIRGGAVIFMTIADYCQIPFPNNHYCETVIPSANILPTKIHVQMTSPSSNGEYTSTYTKPVGGDATFFAEVYTPGFWYVEIYYNSQTYSANAIVELWNVLPVTGSKRISDLIPSLSYLGSTKDTIRIRGKILPPVTGTYTLFIWTDDYGKILINDNVVTENDNPPLGSWCIEINGNINLVANQFYNFQADCLDIGGREGIELSWSYPGQSKENIPSKYIWYADYVSGGPIKVEDCTAQCTACKNYICDSCNSGYTLVLDPGTGKSLCLANCGTGKFRDPSTPTVCSSCPVDTYNPKVNSVLSSDCLSCGDGKYAPAGSASCGTCHNLCQRCYGINSNQCSVCWGYPNVVSPAANSCGCATKYFYDASKSIPNFCVTCQPGTYEDHTGVTCCKDCAAGSYTKVNGELSCTPCEEGTYNNVPKQTSCIECGPGTCQPLPGKTTCNDCGPGHFNPLNKQNTCQECPIGYATNLPQASACTICSQGYYQGVTGQSDCLKCNFGEANNQEGQSICPKCLPGTYADQTGLTLCKECQPGSFQNLSGKDGCIQCDPGYAVATTKATECFKCSKGTFAESSGHDYCHQCPEGTYQNLEGQDKCINCPTGFFANNKGTIVCKKCCVGTFADGDGHVTCHNCDPGTYQNLEGQSGCTPCDIGKFALDSGSSSCKNCAKGMYSPSTGASSCTKCNPGWFQDEEGKGNCKDCLPGEYSPIQKSTFCTLCSPGTFTNAINFASCLDCDPGQFQDKSGQSFCEDCPVGKYNPGIDKTKCLECPKATHNSLTKRTKLEDCLPCDADYYNNLIGQENCIPCPANSYSAVGTEICTCKKGAYYNVAVWPNYCPKCHSFCTACETTDRLCSECLDNPGIKLINGNSCVCQTTNGYFIRKNAQLEDECIPCHPMCKMCHGTSFIECDECWDDITLLAPYRDHICNCLPPFFYDSTKTEHDKFCQPCQDFCQACIGVSTYCTLCLDNPGITFKDNKCLCGVEKSSPYFSIYNSTLQKYTCVKCHPMCSKCFGPYSDQCTECQILKGAYFVETNTCTCASKQFFDQKLDKCLPCHYLCKECTGSDSKSCKSCESYALSVEDRPTICLHSCNELPGYFLYQGRCKRCHPDCLRCVEGTDSDCELCSNTVLVQYKGKCIGACPPHFYAYQGICYECHESCASCINGTRKGCTSCKDPLLLFNFQCFTECPPGSYLENKKCLPCMSPCNTCTSITQCTSCAVPFYFDTENQICVLGKFCPPGTYPDDPTRICQPCHKTCFTCSGPGENQCLSCNYAIGYSKPSPEIGPCFPVICVEGTFLYINVTAKKASCQRCHLSCRTCDDFGADHCITCIPGTKNTKSGIKNRVFCKKCSEIDSGYLDTENLIMDKCQEICGDGRNLGMVQCDDGNTVNGDGCNSNCEVEQGYFCSSESISEPDICIDIAPPTATLHVLAGNKLIVEFAELVKSTASFTELMKKMKVSLENTISPCEMTWSIGPNYVANTNFINLTIITRSFCIIKGINEEFIVQFTDTSLIRDRANNKLATTLVRAPARKQSYIPESSKKAMAAAGTLFSSSGLTTFALSVGLVVFQSVAVGSFWSFVNIIQILSYLPMIDCLIPYILEIFLTQYLTMGKLTIPYSILPNWFPNPLDWLSDLVLSNLGENYIRTGISSVSFLYNFADQLTTWIVLGIIYIFLKALSAITPNESCGYIRRWKKEYEFNAVLRLLIEAFLQMSFCSLLNIWKIGYSSMINLLSLITASIALYLCGMFMVVTVRLIENSNIIIMTETFREKYGTIVEGLEVSETSSFWKKAFYPLFLIRRFAYALVLAVLMEYPRLQLVVSTFALIIPMFIYLIIFRPYETRNDNLLNLYNEAVLVIVFLVVTLMNFVDFSEKTQIIIGWGLSGFVMLSLIITWILIIPTAVRAILLTVRNCFAPKQKAQITLATLTPLANSQTHKFGTKSILTDDGKSSIVEEDKRSEIRIRDEISGISRICHSKTNSGELSGKSKEVLKPELEAQRTKEEVANALEKVPESLPKNETLEESKSCLQKKPSLKDVNGANGSNSLEENKAQAKNKKEDEEKTRNSIISVSTSFVPAPTTNKSTNFDANEVQNEIRASHELNKSVIMGRRPVFFNKKRRKSNF